MHQDDSTHYNSISRPVQLNCQVDFLAKKVIWDLEGKKPPPQEMLPLEPIAVFAGKQKITLGPGGTLRFWAHRSIARRVMAKQKILFPDQFEEVAWSVVHQALWDVPRMFQIWAAKQVMELAGTNKKQST